MRVKIHNSTPHDYANGELGEPALPKEKDITWCCPYPRGVAAREQVGMSNGDKGRRTTPCPRVTVPKD